MWTKFVYCILAIRLFLSLSVNSTSHFSNFVDFRQLQIPNARNITKLYLLIPKHLIIQLTKLQFCILNLSTTFRHCRKKFRLILNKGVGTQFIFNLANHTINNTNQLETSSGTCSDTFILNVTVRFSHFSMEWWTGCLIRLCIVLLIQ